MEFISMRAINCRTEDRLNREKFIQHFIAIISNDTTESRIIQFNGKWGTGKTSIMNLVEKELEESEKYIYVKFDPWFMSSEYNLQLVFFEQLKRQLKIKNGDKYKFLISKFGELTDFIVSSIYLPTFSIPLTALIRTLNFINRKLSKSIKATITATSNLEKIKSSIGEYFSQSSAKLIVVIDDVDRLTNKQILDVLILLKTVANFNNSVYIIPADYEIIYKAVEMELKRGNGIDYVSKIFDTVIEVPKSNPEALKSLLIEKINEIIESVPVTEEKQHDVRMQNTFLEILDSDQLTMRKVNQYINDFQITARDKYSIVNLYELMILEYIRLFFPRIFKIIYENINIFTIDQDQLFSNGSYSSSQLKNDKLSELLNNSIKKLDGDREKNIFSVIIYDFFYNIGYIDSKFTKSIKPSRKSKSVQYREYYNRYFSGLADKDVLYEDVLSEIETIGTTDAFVSLFEKYIRQGNLSNFLYEFESIDNVDKYFEKSKFILLIKAIFIVINRETTKQPQIEFLQYTDARKLYFLAMKIFTKILNKTPEENQKLIGDYLVNFTVNEKIDIIRYFDNKTYLFRNYNELYTKFIKDELKENADEDLLNNPEFKKLMYELNKFDHARSERLYRKYLFALNGDEIYAFFYNLRGKRTNLSNHEEKYYIDLTDIKNTFKLSNDEINVAFNKMSAEQRAEIEQLLAAGIELF